MILYSPMVNATIMRVSAASGTPAAVTKLTPGQGTHRWPHFLPDGRRFLFLAALGQPDTRGIFLASLDGGEPMRVLNADTSVAVQEGRLLAVSQGALVAHRFDAAGDSIGGDAIALAQGVGVDAGGATGLGGFSVSAGGTLAHRNGATSPTTTRLGGSSRREAGHAWRDRRVGACHAGPVPERTTGRDNSHRPGQRGHLGCRSRARNPQPVHVRSRCRRHPSLVARRPARRFLVKSQRPLGPHREGRRRRDRRASAPSERTGKGCVGLVAGRAAHPVCRSGREDAIRSVGAAGHGRREAVSNRADELRRGARPVLARWPVARVRVERNGTVRSVQRGRFRGRARRCRCPRAVASFPAGGPTDWSCSTSASTAAWWPSLFRSTRGR